jgi:NDP-sugar pyrophosphorylase family protein
MHSEYRRERMINVVIPMAGRGSRFADAGYTFPKPLIDVNGKPMIQVVVENIGVSGRYIFIVLAEHYEKYALKYLLPLITRPNPCEIVIVDTITEGAACTVLLAKEFINNSDELIIANSDQWVNWVPDHFLRFMRENDVHGGMLTFTATHPKWSFARVEEGTSRVVEVAEKKPISNIATVGIYYFKEGRLFVDFSKQMIEKNVRVNDEFYVCPVFNEMIEASKSVHVYPVASMQGLGTPEDLQSFLSQQRAP